MFGGARQRRGVWQGGARLVGHATAVVPVVVHLVHLDLLLTHGSLKMNEVLVDLEKIKKALRTIIMLSGLRQTDIQGSPIKSPYL